MAAMAFWANRAEAMSLLFSPAVLTALHKWGFNQGLRFKNLFFKLSVSFSSDDIQNQRISR
jgi:hypothetical protein